MAARGFEWTCSEPGGRIDGGAWERSVLRLCWLRPYCVWFPRRCKSLLWHKGQDSRYILRGEVRQPQANFDSWELAKECFDSKNPLLFQAGTCSCTNAGRQRPVCIPTLSAGMTHPLAAKGYAS